jgi:hypothetical protein
LDGDLLDAAPCFARIVQSFAAIAMVQSRLVLRIHFSMICVKKGTITTIPRRK